jgi:hypothetical protein
MTDRLQAIQGVGQNMGKSRDIERQGKTRGNQRLAA